MNCPTPLPRSRHRLYLLLPLLVLLYACGDTRPNVPDALASLVAEADRARDRGAYADAARLYRQAAGQSATDRDRLLRAAVDMALRDDDSRSAREWLALLAPGDQDPAAAFQRRLLQARLILLEGDVDGALRLLGDSPEQQMPNELWRSYYQTRARAFELRGNVLESAWQLARLDQMLADGDGKAANQKAIVSLLSQLSDTALQLLRPKDPLMGGWMDLTEVLKYNPNPMLLAGMLGEWRERHPGHPAVESYFLDMPIASQPRRGINIGGGPVRHLAVLLPESGRYAAAADYIRGGILAAHMDQAGNGRELRFYDSADLNQVWPTYQQAVADGADWVIGPLTKEAAALLAGSGDLRAPVLALNQIDPSLTIPEQFLQFALSPEDESRGVAEKVLADGRPHVLVFYPENDWGQRSLQALEQHLLQRGGNLVGKYAYPGDTHDFSGLLSDALLLGQSLARKKAVQNVMKVNLEFEPRRRQDMDAIVLIADQGKARQLWPQIQFNHAHDVPVYGYSKIYSGAPNRAVDLDLAGIVFADLPWLLSPANHDLNDGSVRRLAAGLPVSARRLMALGADAYRLLDDLPRLAASADQSLPGLTGDLYLDSGGVVRRQMTWARMGADGPEVRGALPVRPPVAAVGVTPGALP